MDKFYDESVSHRSHCSDRPALLGSLNADKSGQVPPHHVPVSQSTDLGVHSRYICVKIAAEKSSGSRFDWPGFRKKQDNIAEKT